MIETQCLSVIVVQTLLAYIQKLDYKCTDIFEIVPQGSIPEGRLGLIMGVVVLMV